MKTENKLIAEFMGMEKERHTDGRYLFTTDMEETKGIDTRFTEELYFHISWDWLMTVVDKIFSIAVKDENIEVFYEVVNHIPDRHETYKSVVKFIIEYNKNK